VLKYLFGTILLLNSLNAAESGFIIDEKQHLQWQDNKEAQEDIWKMANGYCKQLRIGKYDDWRLPTKEELVSLSQSEKLKEKFVYLQEQVYWSSQSDKDEDLNAITVFSGNGFISSSDKCDKNSIICVRKYKK
jgi:hypothetical protein